MAKPNTKAELKEYALRRLGKPVLEINVSDDQCDDAIDYTLQKFQQFHYDGAERVYLKHKVTQADIDRAEATSDTTTTSTAGTNWLNTWTTYSKEYDTINKERFISNLPVHITADPSNQVFLDFFDMMGQQFDEYWLYTRHFTDLNERTSRLGEGISKDLVDQVAKSVGLNLENGNDLLELPEYFPINTFSPPPVAPPPAQVPIIVELLTEVMLQAAACPKITLYDPAVPFLLASLPIMTLY